MNQHVKLVKRFLVIATSAIATSLLTNSPTQAATITFSDSLVMITKFSQNPINTKTSTRTDTNTLVNGDGLAMAIADAEATFIKDPYLPADTSSATSLNINQTPLPLPTNIDIGLEKLVKPLLSSSVAYNTSYSTVTGSGNDYFGTAESEATVIGDFSVSAGTSFSFDFISRLNLIASSDHPTTENATASGDIFLALVNAETSEVLDFFLATGKVNTNSDQDLLDFGGSGNISLNPLNQQTDFGSNQESANLILKGSLQRDFDQDTNLKLIEFKGNKAEVAVPEPLTILGSFSSGCFLLIAMRQKSKIKGK